MRITPAMLTLAALATLPPPAAEPEGDDVLVFGDGLDLAVAEFGYDDVDYDDFGDLDDDLDDDDFGDDIDGDYYYDGEEDDDDADIFGAIEDRIRRRRRRARRAASRGNHSRAGRLRGSARELEERRRRRRGGDAQPSRRRRQPQKRKVKMIKALISLGGVVAAAGATSQNVVVQHDFVAEDITFAGSSAGAAVTSVFFGDTVIWNNAVGVDISVFATGGFMRGFLKGAKMRAGLTIAVNGTVAGAGDTFKAVLTGWKPASGRC